MNSKDWLRDIEAEIERRVAAAIRRGTLGDADEAMERRTAPNGELVHFSIRGILEDSDSSQDPGWVEPA